MNTEHKRNNQMTQNNLFSSIFTDSAYINIYKLGGWGGGLWLFSPGQLWSNILMIKDLITITTIMYTRLLYCSMCSFFKTVSCNMRYIWLLFLECRVSTPEFFRWFMVNLVKTISRESLKIIFSIWINTTRFRFRLELLLFFLNI